MSADQIRPPADYEALVAELVARGDRLSRRNADVARFCLNHPEDVALSTISRLAEMGELPITAITRFAQELGFAGFPDMQRVFRERLLGPRAALAQGIGALAPIPATTAEDFEDPGRVFEIFLGAAMASLQRLGEDLDRSALGRALALLEGADAVQVAAARGAFGLGAYAVYGLSRSGKRAHLIDNIGAMRAEQVGAMAPDDVLLAITFDDYTAETVEVVKRAHVLGHRVLAITDNELSPVVPLAEVSLFVKEARLGHFRSQVPAMVLLQSLIASLGRRIGRQG